MGKMARFVTLPSVSAVCIAPNLEGRSAVVSTLAYHAASPGSIPGLGCENY